MNAEIISVGTELLLGDIANTDAMDVSRALARLGIDVYRHTVVGDNPQRLREAVNEARSRADIIITTGGLGPTYDDLTKQVLADSFSLPLYRDEAEAKHLEEFFASRSGIKMTDNNYQQAMLPEGCTVFHNDWGTAPGCAFCVDRVHVIMLPGPPGECVPMLENCAVPYLQDMCDQVIVSRNIHVFGLGESAVEEKLRPLMLSLENPTLAPYAKNCEVLLRVTAKADDARKAEDMIVPVIEKIKDELGDIIYGIDCGSLEQKVFDLLTEKGMTFAAAESCTGGLLSKRITDIPGASRVFTGGAVTYTNGCKEAYLGIEPGIIDEYGAVSPDVAAAMAEGVRTVPGADIGIGITGLAGPDGDGVNEVGTVFVSLAAPDATYIRSLSLGGDRARIRTLAVNNALDMIRRHLTELPIF